MSYSNQFLDNWQRFLFNLASDPFYSILLCLFSLFFTFYYAVNFIIAIRLRGEIISFGSFFLLTIAIVSFILIFFTNHWIVFYILFDDQDAIASLNLCLSFTICLIFTLILFRIFYDDME